MIITPIIDSNVARSCHPLGCHEMIKQQVKTVKNSLGASRNKQNVLILGASSGFGLAARICLTFGGGQANTLGVSYERGPSDKILGTAGWYNNIYFKQEAERHGYQAINIVGDAFAKSTRQQVAEAIQQKFNGKVDLVIYSLATGARPNPVDGTLWRSTIKPIKEAQTGYNLNLEHETLDLVDIPPATTKEIEDTVKVMGGEDWQEWVDFLQSKDLLASGCQTLAFSYIGSPLTHNIYHRGTLGAAKEHLHQSVTTLNQQLAPIQGSAHVVVCKALVTKASAFIPTFSPYMLALYQVMKQQGLHEGCLKQMQRLFKEKLSTNKDEIQSDANGLIRLDDWELRPEVQQQTAELIKKITPENFKDISDYQQYRQEFMQLNGFEVPNINYEQPVDMAELLKLKP
ncbi:TPA: enoyl-ACP reductase FabV [Photobacterium damselae]